jgi:hypothetical protein
VGDWAKDLPAKLIEWAAVGFFGFLVAQLLEWRKRIHFAASDWKLEYFHSDDEGNWWYDEQPITESEKRQSAGGEIQYAFTARFFNKKSKTVGLHRVSIRFTKGPWYNRAVVFEDREPSHGRPKVRSGRVDYKKLGEITLTSHDWTTEDISGLVPKYEQLTSFDNAWFSALTAEGRKFKRKII